MKNSNYTTITAAIAQILESRNKRNNIFIDYNPNSPIAETMFETVSFHIVKPCNMKCKFCYATFDDMHVGPQISLLDAQTVIRRLKEAGMQKITFAGGEPMLYKHLDEVIRYSKKIGLTTSIITNGSLLSGAWLNKMKPYLDWIGLSIDSINPWTNISIGRVSNKEMPNAFFITEAVKHYGYKLKINTVVNAYNWHENLNDLISFAKPDRWKVFQALRVEGQNDSQFDEMKVTTEQWGQFLSNHKKQHSIIPESNSDMTGSYLLVDPVGRLFENSSGKHTYSDPLQDSNVADCLKQLNLDRHMFIKRGGIYEW